MIDDLKKKLNILNPKLLEVINESSKHIGHVGYSNNNSHFKIIVVSDEFQNLSKIARHKVIYKILEGELKNKIHALSIQAFTMQEYTNS